MSTSVDTTELFYQRVIKAPLSLQERKKIGDCLIEAARIAKKNEWEDISIYKEKFNEIVKRINKTGYLNLKSEVTKRIAKEIRTIPFKGIGQEGAGRRTETEELDKSNVMNLPSVKALLNDKNLYRLVSNYLGAPAQIHTVQAWWQYPMGENHKPSNAQLWHRDRDDLVFIKLFLYGTDVDEECGPHAYLPNSHNPENLRDLFKNPKSKELVDGSIHKFITDETLQSLNPSVEIKKWIGKAGTCFLEDTRGFHRAYVPTKKPRLIFSVLWTIGNGFKN